MEERKLSERELEKSSDCQIEIQKWTMVVPRMRRKMMRRKMIKKMEIVLITQE